MARVATLLPGQTTQKVNARPEIVVCGQSLGDGDRALGEHARLEWFLFTSLVGRSPQDANRTGRAVLLRAQNRRPPEPRRISQIGPKTLLGFFVFISSELRDPDVFTQPLAAFGQFVGEAPRLAVVQQVTEHDLVEPISALL